MLNSALPGITQLPESVLINPNWSEKNEQPKLTPIKDVEWVHLLFNHPRETQYNDWQIKYLPAPTITERNILIALRNLQLDYVHFITMKKADRAAVQAQAMRVRMQFARLDKYTQNWIIQLLVGHQDGPKMPRMNSRIYIPVDKYLQIEKTWLATLPRNKEYVTEVNQYWKVADDDNYQNIDSFPHEVFRDTHPLDIDWNYYYPYYKIKGIDVQKPPHGKAKPLFKDSSELNIELLNANPNELINDNGFQFMEDPQKYGYNPQS